MKTLNDCQYNHEGPKQYEIQSILKSIPINRGVLKTLEGVLQAVKKITDDKASDVGLKLTRGSCFNSKWKFHNRGEDRVLC